jgi:hypothetical protein
MTPPTPSKLAQQAAEKAVAQIMTEARPKVTGDYKTDAEAWPEQGIDDSRMVAIISSVIEPLERERNMWRSEACLPGTQKLWSEVSAKHQGRAFELESRLSSLSEAVGLLADFVISFNPFCYTVQGEDSCISCRRDLPRNMESEAETRSPDNHDADCEFMQVLAAADKCRALGVGK